MEIDADHCCRMARRLPVSDRVPAAVNLLAFGPHVRLTLYVPAPAAFAHPGVDPLGAMGQLRRDRAIDGCVGEG